MKNKLFALLVILVASPAFAQNPVSTQLAIVALGFSSLATTPVWYQILSGSMFGATVGIRWWRRTISDT